MHTIVVIIIINIITISISIYYQFLVWISRHLFSYHKLLSLLLWLLVVVIIYVIYFFSTLQKRVHLFNGKSMSLVANNS